MRAKTTHGMPSFRMIELPMEGTLPIAFSKASKTGQGFDKNGEMQGREPVWKFERNSDDKPANGANFPFENEDTFASIKEPPGAAVESPETSKKLQTLHWKTRLERAGYSVEDGFLIKMPWDVDQKTPAVLRAVLERVGFPKVLTAVYEGQSVAGYRVNNNWSWEVISKDEKRSELRAGVSAKDAVRTVDPEAWFTPKTFYQNSVRKELAAVIRKADRQSQRVFLTAVSNSSGKDSLLVSLGFAATKPREELEAAFLAALPARIENDKAARLVREGRSLTLTFSNGDKVEMTLAPGRYSSLFENLIKNALTGTERIHGIQSFATELGKGTIVLKSPAVKVEFAVADKAVLANAIQMETARVEAAVVTPAEHKDLLMKAAAAVVAAKPVAQPSAEAVYLAGILNQLRGDWAERESHWAVEAVRGQSVALAAWDSRFQSINQELRDVLLISGEFRLRPIYSKLFQREASAGTLVQKMRDDIFRRLASDETPYARILDREASLSELLAKPVDEKNAYALRTRIENVFSELVTLQNLMRKKAGSFYKLPDLQNPEAQFFLLKNIVNLCLFQNISVSLDNGPDRGLKRFAKNALGRQESITLGKRSPGANGKPLVMTAEIFSAMREGVRQFQEVVRARKNYYDNLKESTLPQRTVAVIYGDILKMSEDLLAITDEAAFEKPLRSMLDLSLSVWASDAEGVWISGLSSQSKMDPAIQEKFQHSMERIMIPFFMSTPEEVRDHIAGEKPSRSEIPRSEMRAVIQNVE
ncbi:MAG: hypothetical protein WCG06_04325, partial [Candidatus Omnitrophota bacterium]